MNPSPEYEYLACYVTIWNKSTKALTNAAVEAQWGKYPTLPVTNQSAGTWQSFLMQGRAGAVAGCEGSVTYQVTYEPGYGSAKFYYTCPYSGDNKAIPTNNAVGIKLSVYAQISSICGESGWGTDSSKWGTEGQVPLDGHPLAVLFVVEDAPAS